MVGTEMLNVLSLSVLKNCDIMAVASENSRGKSISFGARKIEVCGMQECLDSKPDFAIFAAGGNTSIEWAPKFATVGTTVVDNSSAWRMDPSVKLIVPEVNGSLLDGSERIVANPNCSTIQMVMVVNPLHRAFGIKRIVVSTYQSVSGTGIKGINQLMEERAGNSPLNPAYPHPIDLNIIPHIDSFLENGYTKEEMKMIHETRKIMQVDSLAVTATTVRVPVTGGHSESVNIEFEQEFTIEKVRNILESERGIVLTDNPESFEYPMPIYCKGKDDVFVGRIRRDFSLENGLNLWITADNLRKGAATNAVQIVELLAGLKGF